MYWKSDVFLGMYWKMYWNSSKSVNAFFVSLSCLNMCQKYDLSALEKVKNSNFNRGCAPGPLGGLQRPRPPSCLLTRFARSFGSPRFARLVILENVLECTGKCTGKPKKCTGKCTGMYLNFTFFIWWPPCNPWNASGIMLPALDKTNVKMPLDPLEMELSNIVATL